MGRALALALFLLPFALAQTVRCDATEVRFDFSAPGPAAQVVVAGTPYYQAGLAAYELLLDGTASARFLPSTVAGEPGLHVTCTITIPRWEGPFHLQVATVSGILPSPLTWTDRLYVQVQVASVSASGVVTNRVPSVTLLSAVPRRRRLATVAYNEFAVTTAVLHLYFFLELSPSDLFGGFPATGTLTLTYRLYD